jgi:3-methyladenine DNA glycosylase/8-oxoguanine DNA glycosylase
MGVVLCARSRHASRQRRLVVKAGSLRLRPPAQTPFAALGRAVVCQRRVGAAAAVIDGRLIAALGGELASRRVPSLPTGGSVLPTCPSI